MEKLKDLILKMNEKGIPLPMVRLEGKPTLTGTFAFISFNTWMVAIVGKASTYLGGVDPSECRNMFVACSLLYLGRTVTSLAKSVTSEKENSEK